MSKYEDIIAIFFTADKALDKRFKVLRQKLTNQKSRLTRKQSTLTEKLEKKTKDSVMSPEDYHMLDGVMWDGFRDLDETLKELETTYQDITNLSYERTDLVDNTNYAAMHKVLTDQWERGYMDRDTAVHTFKETVRANLKLRAPEKPKGTPESSSNGAEHGAMSDARRFRPLESMAPGKLVEDISLDEFEMWVNQFEGYVLSGMGDGTDPGDRIRIRLLKSHMDRWWLRRTQESLSEDNTWAQALNLLQEVINTIFPLFMRRRVCFGLKQGTEKFTDFIRRLMSKAGQAKLEALTFDNLVVHIALCNMRNDRLKEKLMMKHDLTVDGMRTLATNWELAETNKAETNRARVASSRPRGASGQSQDPDTRTCFGCGARGHIRPECPKDLQCTFCGREGHNVSVCRTKKRSEGTEPSDQKNDTARKIGTKTRRNRQKKSGAEKKKPTKSSKARLAKEGKKEEEREDSDAYSTDSTAGEGEESHSSKQVKHRSNRVAFRRRSPINWGAMQGMGWPANIIQITPETFMGDGFWQDNEYVESPPALTPGTISPVSSESDTQGADADISDESDWLQVAAVDSVLWSLADTDDGPKDVPAPPHTPVHPPRPTVTRGRSAGSLRARSLSHPIAIDQ